MADGVDSRDPASSTATSAEPEAASHSTARRVAAFVVTYGVVAAILYFLVPAMVGGIDQAGDALAAVQPITWVVTLLLGVVNLATNWPPMVAGLPGLRLREAAVSNTASAALANTVPEGGAVATGLTFGMQKSWGFRFQAITLGFTATGIWTNLVRYGLLAVALLLWAGRARSWQIAAVGGAVTVLVLAAVGLLALILRSERFARWFGRLLSRLAAPYFRLRHQPRADYEPMLVDFRTGLNGLLKDRWPALTGTMVVSQLATAALLGVSLRLQGIDASVIPASQVYVAFAAAALISLIVPVPGGIGVAEASLLAVLGWQQPDAIEAQILSAIIAYRVAVWLLPIPIGAASYLFWRRNTSWRHSQEEKAQLLPETA